jgi:zinc/manganese transport system substrate-binding protein
MKKNIFLTALCVTALMGVTVKDVGAGKVKVVATIGSYGDIVKKIGGDRVSVTTFVKGNEDPHFVRPKLSFSEKLAEADLFIDSGLDLELWVPALEDTAGNKKIMSGGIGYVSASHGIQLLEVVPVQDRKEGDIHIYGNPHVYNSAVNLFKIAENITTGLKKVDPAGKDVYAKNLEAFEKKLAEKIYGKALVDALGRKTLNKLAAKGKLIDFLEKETYEGKPLVDLLGGWMKQALPLRGKKVVCYHKNWAYFEKEFGLKVVDFIEPKPGLPPTTKHVKKIVDTMKKEGIKVVLAASYYDKPKVESVADKVGAKAVIVDISPTGKKGSEDVFAVIQTILDRLGEAL